MLSNLIKVCFDLLGRVHPMAGDEGERSVMCYYKEDLHQEKLKADSTEVNFGLSADAQKGKNWPLI